MDSHDITINININININKHDQLTCPHDVDSMLSSLLESSGDLVRPIFSARLRASTAA
jgi:hypothetical protein